MKKIIFAGCKLSAGRDEETNILARKIGGDAALMLGAAPDAGADQLADMYSRTSSSYEEGRVTQVWAVSNTNINCEPLAVGVHSETSRTVTPTRDGRPSG